MRVWLKTTGKGVPVKGSRVRVCGLVYIVEGAEDPSDLDDEVSVTECDIQPADAQRGTPVINAELIVRRDHVQS